MYKTWQELIEAGNSMNDYVERIREAFSAHTRTLYGESLRVSIWSADIFPDHIIVREWDNTVSVDKYWRVSYAVDGETVTFAERAVWERVELAYQPVVDNVAPEAVAEALTETILEQVEATIETAGGKTPEAVIIVEGVSLNDKHYTAAALESGRAIFSGARMFRNHGKRGEPRDIDDAVGWLGEAYIGKDKNGRPALRAPMNISRAEPALRIKVEEGLVGALSINARGMGRKNADGIFVVEQFTPYERTSVDFVDVAGAGGYADLSESAPGSESEEAEAQEAARQPLQAVHLQETTEDAEKIALREQVAVLLREKRTGQASAVLEKLIPATYPAELKERIQSQATLIQEAWAGSESAADVFEADVRALIARERDYYLKVSGSSPKVTGVTAAATASPEMQVAAATEALQEIFTDLGVPRNYVGVAVRGRR